MGAIGIAAGVTFLIAGAGVISLGMLKKPENDQPEGYSMEPTFMGQAQSGYQPPSVGV